MMYLIFLYSYFAFWKAYFWRCNLVRISLSVRFGTHICCFFLFLSPHFFKLYCAFLDANVDNGAFWNAYLCLCILVHISVNNPKCKTTNMSRCCLNPSGFAISLHGSARWAPSSGRHSTGAPCREARWDPWWWRHQRCRHCPTTMAMQHQCHCRQGAAAVILE